MTGSAPGDAHGFLDTVVDAGSFDCWDTAPDRHVADTRYAAELAAAADRSGVDDAVVTGAARVAGHRVAVVVSDFGFLAGSIGVATADRVVRAVERATTDRLPLLVSPRTGGTRMQEGTPAFVQMIQISEAVLAHRRAGLPYLVHMRHPTTGGVFASWASLGQFTTAEPGALVGFLGPRVYRTMRGTPFPDVQRAEQLLVHGVIDAVIARDTLAAHLGRFLDVVMSEVVEAPARQDEQVPVLAEPGPDAWTSITKTRAPGRQGLADLLAVAATHVTRIPATGAGETDPTVLACLARLGGVGCVVVGHDRTALGPGPDDTLTPAGLRLARRAIALAGELGLPVVTVIDTPGMALTAAAEERAAAGEIARCLADLVSAPVPTVSVLLGEGAGGGALALLPGDRVIAAEHAWLSPLPPEGASAIVYRDTDHAPELARTQGVTARELAAIGLVDVVVPERSACALAEDVGRTVATQLSAVAAADPTTLAAARREKHRALAHPVLAGQMYEGGRSSPDAGRSRGASPRAAP